jgi:hypothetical protein
MGDTGASSVCRESNLLDSKGIADCAEVVEFCKSAESWPLELKFDSSSFKAQDEATCFRMARTLVAMGFEFRPPAVKVPQPAGESAPTSTAPSPPQEDPQSNPWTALFRKQRPKETPPARQDPGVPVEMKRSAIMFVPDRKSGRTNVHAHGKGIEGVSATLTCDGETLSVRTMPLTDRGGGDFWGGPVELCPSGKWPYASVKAARLDDSVPGAGFIQLDPREGLLLDDYPADKPLALNRGLPHYKSRRSRSRGEADLRAQCETARYEDSFLFVEGLDEGGAPLSLWIETGVNEKPQRVDTNVTSSFADGIMAYFSRISSISHYHYHPKAGYKSYGPEYPSAPDYEAAILNVLNEYDTRFGYIPGLYDLRIVTPAGVYTMKPDFKAIRANASRAVKDVERYDRFFDDFLSKVKHEYRELSQDDRCRKFADGVSSQFVKVTFEPYSD